MDGWRAGPAAKLSRGIVAVLVVFSLFNQWSFNLKSYFLNTPEIFRLLTLDENQKNKEQAGFLSEAVDELIRCPDASRFYFVPNFPDSPGVQSNAVWWWMMGIALRYFCYPDKKIYLAHQELYGGNLIHQESSNGKKETYLQKFLAHGRTYGDQPWILDRHITHLIVYRHNKVAILPAAQFVDP